MMTGAAPSGGTITATHRYADCGVYLVSLTISDEHLPAVQDGFTAMVKNVAPMVTLVAPTAVEEGGAFTLALTDPTDPSMADVEAGFTNAFDTGDGTAYGPFGTSSSIQVPALNGGLCTVRARIRDKDGGTREYSAPVRVVNVPPMVAVGNPTTFTVGQPLSLAGSFTGPGQETWTVTVDYGDGTGIQPVSLAPDNTFNAPARIFPRWRLPCDCPCRGPVRRPGRCDGRGLRRRAAGNGPGHPAPFENAGDYRDRDPVRQPI